MVVVRNLVGRNPGQIGLRRSKHHRGDITPRESRWLRGQIPLVDSLGTSHRPRCRYIQHDMSMCTSVATEGRILQVRTEIISDIVPGKSNSLCSARRVLDRMMLWALGITTEYTIIMMSADTTTRAQKPDL